jgi:endonuclease/exonuclease/phosphatase family metal-dependent hydrolase
MIQFILRIILVGIAVGIGLALLAPQVSPIPLVYYAGTGWGYLLISLVLVTIGLAYVKDRWALYALVLMAIASIEAKKIFNWQSDLTISKPSIRVATFNSNIMKYPNKRMTDEIAAKYKRFITDLDADILCLQEFSGIAVHAQRNIEKIGLNKSHPYYYKPDRLGVGIFSRYPLYNKTNTQIWDHGNGGIFADIETPIGNFRLFNVHLLSNLVTKQTTALMSGEGEEEASTAAKNIMKKVYRSTDERLNQAIVIRKLADQSPYPAIICGDFNETPMSRTYKTLSYGRTDAFVERGFGFGSTFTGKIPLLRIDYVLTHKKFEHLQYETFKPPLSDHKAVVVTLGL